MPTPCHTTVMFYTRRIHLPNIYLTRVINPKMDMQKIVTLEGFGVRTFCKKNATLNKNQLKSWGGVTYR